MGEQTVTDMLAERCNAGDVQTCVAVCLLCDHVKPETIGRKGWPSTAQPPRSGDTQRSRRLALDLCPLSSLLVTDKQRRQWCMAYVDILHSLDLNVVANEVILGSPPKHVMQRDEAAAATVAGSESDGEEPEKQRDANDLSALNTRSTTVYTSCSQCNSAIAPTEAPRFCLSCKSALSR
jgi:hypothetical protein